MFLKIKDKDLVKSQTDIVKAKCGRMKENGECFWKLESHRFKTFKCESNMCCDICQKQSNFFDSKLKCPGHPCVVTFNI